MLKNYIKTALRNIWRNRGFSLINIAGLTFGITACFLIGLFVWDEKQFDKFIPDGERVYRLYNVRTDDQGTSNNVGTPPMFATTLKEFPEVESVVRVMYVNSNELMQFKETGIYEDKGIIVDPTYPDIFPLPLKYGSWKKALEPGSIVISEELSSKYFGNSDPVGQELMWDRMPFKVTAVFKSDLERFHLPVNYIVPLESLNLPERRIQSWGWQQFYNYVKLKKGTNVANVETRFQQVVKERSAAALSGSGFTYQPYFQPLYDIHLYAADFKFDQSVKGNITYVKALTLIAIFILIIACLNFINLATAKSLQRAKEIGVRKSIGAGRTQLIFQFIGETILLTLISVLIAVAFTICLLPLLNQFTGKSIPASVFFHPLSLVVALVFAFVVGLLSGFYPALVMSGFQPVKVLKGILTEGSGSKKPLLRQALVIIQFALSGLLIISVIIVYQQVNYLHNKNLGFNKDQILFIPLRGENFNTQYASFKTELERIPGVKSVALGYGFPGDLTAGDEVRAYKDGELKTYSSTQIIADHDYVKTLDLKIIAGRDFSKEISTDPLDAFIINETAVKELGYGDPQKAIGQRMEWNAWSNTNPDTLKKGKVIGVVKDFHYKSLYDKVGIAVIQIFPFGFSRVAIKLNSANVANTIAAANSVWNKYSPEYPMEYWFLDENFDKMYRSEDKLQTLLFTFTGIAIFVACLGLLGLAAYAAERRRKEIGIRKVLGASVNGITILLSKDFLKLVLIAFVISAPIAWYFMNNWLQDFAYRITIDWKVFVAAGAFALLIALITVSFQAIKAALANPVKSLRTE